MIGYSISTRFAGPVKQIAGAPPALYSTLVDCMRGDDNWSACPLAEGEIGKSFVEPVVVFSKNPGFSDSTDLRMRSGRKAHDSPMMLPALG